MHSFQPFSWAVGHLPLHFHNTATPSPVPAPNSNGEPVPIHPALLMRPTVGIRDAGNVEPGQLPPLLRQLDFCERPSSG